MIHLKNSFWNILLAGVLLTACTKPEYPTPNPATGPSTSTARVLFVNAAPGAPQLNLLVNNVQAGNSVNFGSGQSSYSAIQAGSVQLRGKAATGQIGGTLGANDLLFRAGTTNQTNYTAAAGRNFTVFVTDTLTRPRDTSLPGLTDPGGLRFLVTTDALPALATGRAFVRFLNLSPNAQGLELFNTATNQSLLPTSVEVTNPRTGNKETINNAQRRAFREFIKSNILDLTAFTAIDAGSYTLQIRNSGLPSSNGRDRALPAPVLFIQSLEAGKIYTIFVKGLVGGGSGQEVSTSIVEHPRS